MRKSIILLGSALLFATASFAQDEATSSSGETKTAEVLKSKKGETILPEEGDLSIGVDASPFLRFAGNMLNSTVSQGAPTWNAYNAQPFSIIVKKFKDPNTAYRALVAIHKANLNDSREVNQAVALPNDLYFGDKIAKVTDTRATGFNALIVGGGLEKRRGYGRLQGFYGGEALISVQGSQKSRYTYGNALTQNTAADQVNVNPNDANYTTNFGANIGNAGNFQQHAGVTSARMLSQKTNTSFGFGLRGFIGAEYFFMPKMSIGGEFGWGLAFVRTGATTTEWEAEGLTSNGEEAAAIITETTKARRTFGIDEQSQMPHNGSSLINYLSPNGTLRLNFHF